MAGEFKVIDVPKKNYFTCGYCIYGRMQEPPEEVKKADPNATARGYCIFEPPKVFPMSVQENTKIAALGTQPKVDVQPYMLRPVVEENEPMCGRGMLNKAAVTALGLEEENPEKEELCSGDGKTCKREECRCGTN